MKVRSIIWPNNGAGSTIYTEFYSLVVYGSSMSLIIEERFRALSVISKWKHPDWDEASLEITIISNTLASYAPASIEHFYIDSTIFTLKEITYD